MVPAYKYTKRAFMNWCYLSMNRQRIGLRYYASVTSPKGHTRDIIDSGRAAAGERGEGQISGEQEQIEHRWILGV